jgi:YD repeat-containing protein
LRQIRVTGSKNANSANTYVTVDRIDIFAPATSTPTVTTQYDGEGNVGQRVDGTGAVSASSFDPLGRLVVQTNPISGTTLYTYTYTYTATAPTAVQDPHIEGKAVELALAIVGKKLAAALVQTGVDRALLFVLNKESCWARGLRTWIGPEDRRHTGIYLPILQLRRDDLPELPFPDDSNLFQLVWCPRLHEDDYQPRIRLYWRREREITHPRELSTAASADERRRGEFVGPAL